jgi:Fe-S-cluster containining protein
MPWFKGNMTDVNAVRPEVLELEIEMVDGKLRATLAVPPRPLRLSELAWNFMGISERLTDAAVRREAREGRTVSCKKGCVACCRQLVPLSPPEAWMIADLIAGLPQARRECVLAVFAHTDEVLQRSGLKAQLQGRIESPEHMTALVLAYFRLGVPCPFLLDESCSVYRYRPSICREYLVTSPAGNCSYLGLTPIMPIARIQPAVRLSEALSRLTGKLLDCDPEVVPLSLALGWSEQHRDEGRLTWDPRFLIESLVAELSAKQA